MSTDKPNGFTVIDGGPTSGEPPTPAPRRPVCHLDGTVSYEAADGSWCKRSSAVSGGDLERYSEALQLRVLKHLSTNRKAVDEPPVANTEETPPEPIAAVAAAAPEVEVPAVVEAPAAPEPAAEAPAVDDAATRRRAALRERAASALQQAMPSLPSKPPPFNPTRLQDALVDYSDRTIKDLVATGMSCFAEAARRLESARVQGRNFAPDVKVLRAAANVGHKLLTKR